jgi:hypothetical protein
MAAPKISNEIKNEIKEIENNIPKKVKQVNSSFIGNLYNFVSNIFSSNEIDIKKFEKMDKKYKKKLLKTLDNYVSNLSDEKYKNMLRYNDSEDTNVRQKAPSKTISNKYAAFIKLDNDIFIELNRLANKMNDINEFVIIRAEYNDPNTNSVKSINFYVQGDMNSSFTHLDSEIIKNLNFFDNKSLYLLTDEEEINKQNIIKKIFENKTTTVIEDIPIQFTLKLGLSILSYNKLTLR